MNLLFLDFETYWDQDVTLKKLTYNEYLFHDLFKVHMCGVAINNKPISIFDEANLIAFFASVDWKNTAVISHNIMFDGSILVWHYDCHPAFFFDTQGMVHHHWPTEPNSLENSAVLCFPDDVEMRKGKELILSKGVTTLDKELFGVIATYCHQDTFLCHAIFHHLIDEISQTEIDIIDHTARLFLYPKMIVDTEILHEMITDSEAEKLLWREKVGATSKQLNSGPQFSRLLNAAGAEVPTKISKRTGYLTTAFSKQDLGFQELMVHPDQAVRDLVTARIISASTQTISPPTNIIKAAGYHEGFIPVPMKYAAAKTRRFGSTQKINFLNLAKKGRLREAIQAPKGFVLVTCDMSQIEARLLAYVAGQQEMLTAFADPTKDIYCDFGYHIYNRTITKKDVDDRFVAKGAVLGLGYYLGAAGFNRNTQSKAKTYLDKDIILGEELAQKIVTLYRTTFPEIPGLWDKMGGATNVLKSPNPLAQFTWDLFTFRRHRVDLPDGTHIGYNDAMLEFMHGGKLTENLMQALCRILLVHHILEIEKHIAPVTFHVYDEITVLAPESQADDILKSMIEVMSQPLDWCADLPMAAEGDYSYHYCK